MKIVVKKNNTIIPGIHTFYSHDDGFTGAMSYGIRLEFPRDGKTYLSTELKDKFGTIIVVGDHLKTSDGGITSPIIFDGEHFGYNYVVYEKKTHNTYTDLTIQNAKTMIIYNDEIITSKYKCRNCGWEGNKLSSDDGWIGCPKCNALLHHEVVERG